MVCMALWRQSWKSSAPSRGADSFSLPSKKVIGPIKVHVDNKGTTDCLWRGQGKCIDPKAGDADLWIRILEELHVLMSREKLVEVEHVKAHRTKKDKTDMSHFEKFATDGNERTDERSACSPAVFTAWWKNGKIVWSSSRSQKKSAMSWIRTRRKRNIERSGVLVEEAVGT